MKRNYKCDEEHIIWARGPNCWGRGKNMGEAIRFASSNAPIGWTKRIKWQVSLTPVESGIDLGNGYLSWSNHTCNEEECRSFQVQSEAS